MGPIKIKKGFRLNIPTTRPIDAPTIPYLVVPKYFEAYIGIRLSRINIIMAITNVITSMVLSISAVGIKLNINRPNQDVSGPGIIGIKLPTIPRIINSEDIIIRKRSIDIIR